MGIQEYIPRERSLYGADGYIKLECLQGAWQHMRERTYGRRRTELIAGHGWLLQEELLLSLVVAMAISWLLLSLRTESAQDYIFACFFLICTSSLLKIRWLLGTLALTPPLLLIASASLWNPAMTAVLPRDAEVHLTVAWATGGLMSFVADSYRRSRY
jgi:hypothetical protein